MSLLWRFELSQETRQVRGAPDEKKKVGLFPVERRILAGHSRWNVPA